MIRFSYLIVPLFFALILNDGALGGDEYALVTQIQNILDGGKFSFEDYIFHHIGWALIKLPGVLLHGILLDTGIPRIILDYFLVLDTSIALALSYYISYLIFEAKTQSKEFAFLVSSAIYFGSPIISLWTGGFVENFIILFMILRYFSIISDNFSLRSKFLFDSILFLLKPYMLAVIFLFYVLDNRTKKNKWYLLSGSLLVLAIVYLRLFLWWDPSHSVIVPRLDNLLSNISLLVFSVPFGLVSSYGFLTLYLLFVGSKSKEILIERNGLMVMASVGMTLVLLCLFDFWYGPAGVSGPRYVVPFVILLCIYFIQYSKTVDGRAHNYLLALVLLHAPMIDYRNSLLFFYSDRAHLDIRTQLDLVDHFKVTCMPIVFSWAAALGNFNIFSSTEWSNLIPQSGLSRGLEIIQLAFEGEPFDRSKLRVVLSDSVNIGWIIFFVIFCVWLEFLKRGRCEDRVGS